MIHSEPSDQLATFALLAAALYPVMVRDPVFDSLDDQ